MAGGAWQWNAEPPAANANTDREKSRDQTLHDHSFLLTASPCGHYVFSLVEFGQRGLEVPDFSFDAHKILRTRSLLQGLVLQPVAFMPKCGFEDIFRCVELVGHKIELMGHSSLPPLLLPNAFFQCTGRQQFASPKPRYRFHGQAL